MVCMCILSCAGLFVIPWTGVPQDAQFIEFSMKGEWVPFPSPGDLPHLGIEPASLALTVSFVGRQILYH